MGGWSEFRVKARRAESSICAPLVRRARPLVDEYVNSRGRVVAEEARRVVAPVMSWEPGVVSELVDPRVPRGVVDSAMSGFEEAGVFAAVRPMLVLFCEWRRPLEGSKFVEVREGLIVWFAAGLVIWFAAGLVICFAADLLI